MVGRTESNGSTFEINEHFLEAFRLTPDVERARIWDSKLPGFGVTVGKRRMSFVVQRRIKGDRTQSSVTLGQWAPSKLRAMDAGLRDRTMSVQIARGKAIEALGTMRSGHDPRGDSERSEISGPTLGEAMARHLDRMRKEKRAPRSIETVAREIELHVSDWTSRRLAEITRADCCERHERLTESSGEYLANRVMRHLRCVYNSALKEIDLPINPTIGVHWNKEQRRQEPIPWVKLPAWFQAVNALESGMRRDYNLLVLLTGLRKMDAATIRWEHVDFKLKTLTRPNPKGGKDRAFVIPLSSECVKILKRRHADNIDDHGWAFPTDALGARTRKNRECHLCAALGLPAIHEPGARVHLIEPHEEGEAFVTPHRLRDTYTTALVEVGGVSPFAIDVLTNHRPPRGSVTSGYVDLSTGHLAECQERVSRFLLGKCAPKKRRS